MNYSNPAKAGKPEDMAWWHLPLSCPQGGCTLHLRAQAQGSLVTVLYPSFSDGS